MQAADLVELAAMLATHGPSLIRCPARPSDRSIEQYWTSSRCRMDRWSRSLNRYTKLTERRLRAPRAEDLIWLRMRCELEEIFTSEVLTRVWSAVSHGYDQLHQCDHLEPTAHSVLIGHLEARQRALRLLVDPMAMKETEAEQLNRLRRRTERWIDLLIGRLMAQDVVDMSRAACDPVRSSDFAEDLRRDQQLASHELAWPIIANSLRATFGPDPSVRTPNADLNKQIATSILACFPPDTFESVGLAASLWQVRLSNKTDDVEGLLKQIIQLDHPTTFYFLDGDRKAYLRYLRGRPWEA